MAKIQRNFKFEQALQQLEKMINKLEEGELPLEDSLKVFEEGMELVKFCEQKLNESEGKIEMLKQGKRDEKHNSL